MKFSTRSRYGLRFMIELAARSNNEKPVYLREISSLQDISEKYLSKLVLSLKAAGLVTSERGTSGGYKLGRLASEISVLDIVEALDGSIFPVECSKSPSICNRYNICHAKDIWCELGNVMKKFLSSKKLDKLGKMATSLKDYNDNMYYI